MSVLVIADYDGQSLSPATLTAVTAGLAIDIDLHLLLIGGSAAVSAQLAAIKGVTKVIHAGSGIENPLPETAAPIIAALAKDYTHIISAATTTGKNLMPRVAGILGIQPISDVTTIIDAQTFKRPVYAGNAIATVRSSEAINILTIRTTAFDPADASGGAASISEIPLLDQSGKSRFISSEKSKSARPDLAAAKIVVSGGRGLGSADNFKLVETLADKLGAAVGASRAAVDAGYAPNDYQVGQTGRIVAPQLYIAIGISGAIQHLAGMKDSKIIVAINKDADAPIFQMADYGIVGDLFEVMKELTEKI